MYNPTHPPWPLFRSRLMKLYPRISKKALWKSSLIEVSDKLNMSKLHDNKISRTLSIFPYKPLIFWWQNLFPFFDMSVLNSLLLVGHGCDLMSPHSSNNNKHIDFSVVITYFRFIRWNVNKTKLSRPSYKCYLVMDNKLFFVMKVTKIDDNNSGSKNVSTLIHWTPLQVLFQRIRLDLHNTYLRKFSPLNGCFCL